MTTQPNIKVSDAFEMFILAKDAKNVASNTLYLYGWAHRLWRQRFGDIELACLAPELVRKFLLWLQGKEQGEGVPPAPATDEGHRLSSSTVHAAFRNLKTFFIWCEREDLIKRSPTRNVEPPMLEEKVPECLTEEEADRLLTCVLKDGDRNAYRDYVIHLFFLCTAVRLFELAGLNIDDIDLKAGFAKVYGKGRKERIVSLGQVLPLEIKRYMLKHRQAATGEKALFVNERGRRLGKRGIQIIVARDLKRYLGRPLSRIGPHTYRHTSITFRLRQTGDLERTRLAAGHSDARTTERYIHLIPRDLTHGEDGKPYSPMDSILRNWRGGHKRDTLRGDSQKPDETPSP